MSSLYNRDFNLWIQKTVSNLKNKDMGVIDWENLIDEIEGMGKSDRRALRSYLERLIEHLLKLKYWDAERDRCKRGWKIEILEFRSRIERILDDSPSLKNYLTEIYPKAHRLAVARMSILFDLPNEASISEAFALSDNFSDKF
ncbi:protein of unknown function DUF29 [Xenococcus sp. PCC 7305]|uniref:DUF29 domain-containing protein n=1 Tax=Xenococcus sp. PCC 7305 TaxID=102125 RepID=UPI0002AC90C9|nr:DUF29 domain-containing protein [Xenococcus sp. PCC 7305]ELS00875.1 protein of unknown function DUF29 [Xenococcus sp. PCC 7305]